MDSSINILMLLVLVRLLVSNLMVNPPVFFVQDEANVNQVEISPLLWGKGISVTPIQMITAVSAIANDGVLLKPTLVSKVMDGDTVVYEHQPEEVRQVVSAETAATVRELIVNVVTNGSGTQAAIEGHTIGGKLVQHRKLLRLAGMHRVNM